MKAKRIQRKRTKGWRIPEGAIYVGRPGRWGNPFGRGHQRSRRQAVNDYSDWLAGNLFQHFEQERRQWILDNIEDLRGKDPACWCPLDEPCHVDVLIELANQEKS